MAYNLGEAVGYIKLNIQDFINKYNEVHDKTKSLDTVVDGLSGVFDKVGKVAAAAFASVSAAAVAATKSVVEVGSKFESSMSQVAATMGMSADEVNNNSEAFKKLSDAAKEMGATTKFSASEAADALNYLALAGYNVNEATEMLPKVLNLASAGGMDLAKTSDMVTDAMSALNLSIEDADSFIDKMAKTAQKSNTSVEQLGEAILQIGGTANSLAGGVDELDTALGILANNGIKASEGGTALRQVILNLTAPTQKAAEFMEEIGLSAYDAEKNMKPLNQTFSELSDILENMNTQQERDNALAQIFNARQLKSARALLKGYADEWDELSENIANADGAAALMADTMLNNLDGALTIAKSALEGVQVTAFESLKKGLTDAVKEATKSIDELNKKLQSEEMQKNLEKISKTFGDILVKFADFVANKAIPTMIEMFARIEEIGNGLISVFNGLAIAIPIVVTGILALNTQLQLYVAQQIAAKVATLATNAAMLANPYTAIAVAIGLVVTAISNYILEMKRVTDLAKEQETEFSQAADAANKYADILEDAKNQSVELSEENQNQVDKIRELTNWLGEYAKKTELTNDELAEAKIILKELNEIYPENTAYIEDGQVKAYEDLTETVDKYIEKLALQAELEGAKNLASTSYQVMKETEKALEGQEEKVAELEQAYRDAEKAQQYYVSGGLFSQNYTQSAKQEADKLKMTLREYYAYKKELAYEDWQNADAALSKNKATYEDASKTYEENRQLILDKQKKYNALQLAEDNEYLDTVKGIDEARVVSGEASAQKESEAQQRIHAKEIEQQKEDYEKMWGSLEKLEKDYTLGRIENEKDYMEQKKALLLGNKNEDDKKWVAEYGKVVTWEKKENEDRIKEAKRAEKERKQLNDKQLKEYEDGIKEQIEKIKERAEDEEITMSQMYDEIENLIETKLSKESDLYKSQSRDIKKGRKKLNEDLKKEDEKTAKENFKAWEKSYNDIVAEAEKAYKQLETSQKNLQTQLTSGIKMYETETKKVFNKTTKQWEEKDVIKASTKSIKTSKKELEKYIKTLESLEKKGLSKNVFAEIFSMDSEQAAEFAKSFDKMSSSQLKEISETTDEMNNLAEKYSTDFYGSQFEAFTKEFQSKFDVLKANFPEDFKLAGQDTIDGFIKGIQEKTDDSTGALNKLMNDNLNSVKELLGIHSPSTVFEEIGENTIQGYIDGVENTKSKLFDSMSSLGSNSAEKFINGFKSIWDNFNLVIPDNFADVFSKSNEIQASFTRPKMSSENNNKNNTFEDYQNNYVSSSGLTQNDIVSAIKIAMPDGDLILQVGENEFGRVSRKSLNSISREAGQLNLRI